MKLYRIGNLLFVLCLFFNVMLCLSADLQEKIQFTGGLLPIDPVKIDGIPEKYRDGMDPPAYWNWSDLRGQNWMSPVKSQGGCGSCAAFASCGAVEAMLNLWAFNPDLDLDLSEQHVFCCADGECASGLYMGTAFDYFTEFGVPDEDCWTYQGIDLPCTDTCSDWQSRVTQLDNWSLMWGYSSDDTILKQAVWWQPMPVYMEVYADFGGYSAGVYKYDQTSPFSGGHFVVIVGWDDSLDCWICKNSWGSGWGERGYFRIARGEVLIGTWAMDPDLAEPLRVHDGDVNCDGSVTAADAQSTFLAVMGTYPLSALEAYRADCNGDNSITATDAQMIFLKAMGSGDCV